MTVHVRSLLAAFLFLGLLLAGCEEASEPEDLTGAEAESVPDESADEIIMERTPVPTATPDPISLALMEFADSQGLSGETILGLNVEGLIDLGVSILIVIAGYAVGSLAVRLILPRLSRRLPPPYDVQVKNQIGARIRQLILIYLLSLATARLAFLGVGLKRTLTDIYFLVALVIVTQMALDLIELTKVYFVERLETPERRAEVDPIYSLVARFAYGVVILIAISSGLARFGIDITALAAALGIAGLGFALAAQDTIADAIAGMLILADRPFRVGDRIEIEAAKTWGDVMEIGLRTTRIRTRDNRLVIIPNSTISKNEIINYSYPDPQYRIETHVGIAQGTDIEKARQLMIDTVGGVEGVLQEKPVEALYIEMAEYDMKFRVRWWIDSYVDTRRMFDKIHTALQNALDEAGIVQPFPIRELHHQFASDQEGASLTISETRKKPRTGKSTPSDTGSSPEK